MGSQSLKQVKAHTARSRRDAAAKGRSRIDKDQNASGKGNGTQSKSHYLMALSDSSDLATQEKGTRALADLWSSFR